MRKTTDECLSGPVQPPSCLSRLQAPGCSTFQTPGSMIQIPDSRSHVPGSRVQVSGPRFQVPGSRLPGSPTGGDNMVSCSMKHASLCANHKHKVSSPKSEQNKSATSLVSNLTTFEQATKVLSSQFQQIETNRLNPIYPLPPVNRVPIKQHIVLYLSLIHI